MGFALLGVRCGSVDYCYSGFSNLRCEVELKSPSVLIRFYECSVCDLVEINGHLCSH